VLATFVVTLAAGPTVKFGLHRFVGELLLNIWFIIALTVPGSYPNADWNPIATVVAVKADLAKAQPQAASHPV
jgi:hypothetical protein